MTTLCITTKWNDESLNSDTEAILEHHALLDEFGEETSDGHYWQTVYSCLDKLPSAVKVEVEKCLDADVNVISFHWGY